MCAHQSSHESATARAEDQTGDAGAANRAARRAARKGKKAVERRTLPGADAGQPRSVQGRRINPVRRTG